MTSEKVTIIGGNIIGRSIGGVGRLCIELANLLKDKNYTPILITNRPSVKSEAPKNFEWRFLPSQIYNPSNFSLLISTLKKLNPIVIHLHAQVGAIPIAALLRKILKKPVVFTPVTLRPRMASPFYSVERLIPLKYKLLGACAVDHIVCQSSYVQQFLIQQGVSPEKISFVAYGLRNDYYKLIPALFDFPENTVLFWTSGTREKGFDLLLSAIPKIVREIGEVQFVLALLDVEENLLRWLSSLKRRTGKINIAQRLCSSDNYLVNIGSRTYKMPLTQLIVSSNLVVLPYRTNPQEPPLSLVETMALMAPVITSRLGSNVELFMYNSTSLISPNNSQELARAILNALFRLEKCRKRASQLREFIIKRYNRRIALSSISKVYERVVENR